MNPVNTVVRKRLEGSVGKPFVLAADSGEEPQHSVDLGWVDVDITTFPGVTAMVTSETVSAFDLGGSAMIQR